MSANTICCPRCIRLAFLNERYNARVKGGLANDPISQTIFYAINDLGTEQCSTVTLLMELGGYGETIASELTQKLLAILHSYSATSTYEAIVVIQHHLNLCERVLHSTTDEEVYLDALDDRMAIGRDESFILEIMRLWDGTVDFYQAARPYLPILQD